MREFLDILQLSDSVLVGSSLGGLAALRVALHTPDRVSALCLIGSAGLGREVSPALRQMTLPGVGEAAIWWGRTAIGAAQRVLVRMPLLFANPTRAPQSWLAEQYRLAQLPGFLETTLAALRAQVAPKGQRQILLNALPKLLMPTLLVWGDCDLVVSVSQARVAARLLSCGALEVIRHSGHLPHVERPEEFVAALSGFFARLRGVPQTIGHITDRTSGSTQSVGVLAGGLRQLAIGIGAAACTYLVGLLFGATLG